MMILLHDFSGNTITFFLDPAHCRYPDKFSFLPPSVPFHSYSCSQLPVPPPGLHNRRERKRGRGGGCRKKPQQFTREKAHLNERKENIHARSLRRTTACQFPENLGDSSEGCQHKYNQKVNTFLTLRPQQALPLLTPPG